MHTFKKTIILFSLISSFACFSQESKKMTLDDLVNSGYKLKSVTNSKCASDICVYHFHGEINNETVSSFREYLEGITTQIKSLGVVIDSQGGDVYAAIAFGKLLRKYAYTHNAGTSAIVMNRCESACLIGILGATSRFISTTAKIGIHRPYTKNISNLKFENQIGDFKKLEVDIKQYLIEMNIPITLLDEMLRYEVEKMHYMNTDDLSKFRIKGVDYIFQDIVDNKNAAKLNLTKRDYLRSKLEVEKKCASNFSTLEIIQIYTQCRDSIFNKK